jgi:hypothetical protein
MAMAAARKLALDLPDFHVISPLTLACSPRKTDISAFSCRFQSNF